MKNELRKKAKELRKTLDMPAKSSKLCSLIKQDELYKKSCHIMLFYPMKWEVNLLPLLEDEKVFYFPKVQGEELLVCPCGLDANFKKSELGIFEPCTAAVDGEILDLVIVPALMADRKGYRLGYGGGFYDRFLKKFKVPTICAIPKELLVENLPIDRYDVPVGRVFFI